MAWKSGQPTRWEIVAVHAANGRRLLVCYTANKSQRALVRAIQDRGEALVRACGLSRDARISRLNDPFPHFSLADPDRPHTAWRIYPSGRTQRDVQVEGGKLDYIGSK